MRCLRLPTDRCVVWGARTADAHPALARLLDQVELDRRARIRVQSVSDQSLVGAALSRIVAAACLGCGPAAVVVDRRCARCGAPHGKPRIAGVEHSVSHSGDEILVAATSGRPVGVDTEEIVGPTTLRHLWGRSLTDEERAVVRSLPEGRRAQAFTRYWVRKEAIVKATGDGVGAPFSRVQVSAPAAPARLERWLATSRGIGQTWMADLDAPRSHAACVAVLGRPEMELVQVDARPVLEAAAAVLVTGRSIGGADARAWVESTLAAARSGGRRSA